MHCAGTRVGQHAAHARGGNAAPGGAPSVTHEGIRVRDCGGQGQGAPVQWTTQQQRKRSLSGNFLHVALRLRACQGRTGPTGPWAGAQIGREPAAQEGRGSHPQYPQQRPPGMHARSPGGGAEAILGPLSPWPNPAGVDRAPCCKAKGVFSSVQQCGITLDDDDDE